MAFETATLGMAVFLLAASGALEGRTAGVKQVAGAPQLVIDGKPVVPMVFMGIPTGATMWVRIGPEWKRVQVVFISPETAEDAPGFQVRMGGAQGPGKLWIDDLRYYEGTPERPTGPNMQPHGDFEDTGEVMPPRWDLFVWPGTSAQATWAYDDTFAASGRRSLRCDIEDGGQGPGHVHLFLSGCRVEEGKRYTVELSLRADPERQVELVPLHQAPPWTLYPVVGARTPYIEQVELAGKAGVHLQYPIVGMPWPRPDEKPDFTSIDNVFRQTIEADPEALIIIRYGVDPPQWWLDEHPEAKNFCHDGTPAQQWVGDEEWLREACHWQEELIRHIQQRWGDRIVAYHPCGQHTGEWFYIGGWENKIPCFGEGVNRSFRKWLAERYKTLDALGAAWKRPVGSWDEITAPSEKERRTGDLGQLLDPRSQRPLIDFHEFLQETMARAISEIARSCKSVAPDTAVILFYGYVYELAGWPGGIGATGHYGWRWMLDDPNVDIYCSPISYGDRQLGGAGRFMAPVDSVALHGKQWFNEDDTRTVLAPNDGVGQVPTMEGSRWVHLRNFAHIFPRRMGCWYMDLGATGWLNHPDLWANIDRLRRLYEQHLLEPCRFQPEIVAIVDERSALHTPVGSALPPTLIGELRSPLYRTGTSVGWYLLDDLVAGRIPPAKMYVMQNVFVLDDAQRQKLVDTFRRQQATVVWFYAPGYLDPDSGPVSPQAFEELTGMRLAELSAPAADRAEPLPGSAWCEGVAPFGTGRDNLRPQFAVEDGPRVEILARWPNGQAAVAVSDAAGYRSVFIGCLSAPPELFRNIARRAGVHIYCDTNDVIETDGRFLAISATSAGEKTIRLPQPARLVDSLTGETVGRGTDLRLPLSLGEARLLWCEAE